MKEFILAIDLGTTGSRVMILDREGTVCGSRYEEFTQFYPQPGWVEHDAREIWQVTRRVMSGAMEAAGATARNLRGIGITNQRETSLLWDRSTLEPVHRAVVWQCRRSASICEEMKAQGLEEMFRSRTGLLLDAYFSGTKVKWLLDNVPGLRTRGKRGDLAFGTMDTWLIAKLTGGRIHVTDYTNASRTLMFDIHSKKWAQDLLDRLEVPAAVLPEVVYSAGVIGNTDPEILGAPVPIAGVAGDQQAALFGQACFDAGQAKNTYGTGSFLLQNVGAERVEPGHGLLLTLACDGQGRPCYALEGSVFMAGAVVQWLRDGLGLIEDASDTGALAESVPDTQGVYMVPAFAGLGAPHWDMYARGAILGITRGTAKAHVVRAALEGIAFQNRDLVNAFERLTGVPFTELRVDGGACRNDFLMQFQADILGCPVNRSTHPESTGMGAAYLAGLATGFWSSPDEIAVLRTSDRLFEPRMSADEREQACAGWTAAVERIKS